MSVQGEDRLSGTLGPYAVTFMVIACAAPLTVVGGIMPIGFLVGNGAGLPVMFLVATGILLLFSVGLMAMSKRLPHAGAFFTYISHGLGRVPGVAAAYLAVLCYTTIQVAVFSYFGATVTSSIVLLGGPDIPWWIATLACVAVVAVLGYRHIELSSRVLFVALMAEMAIVLALAASITMTGGAEGLSLSPFSLENILSGSPALGLMFAISGFIGFESTVVYRSEVRDPDRTIPRATYGSALVIGIFYALAAWAIVMGVGQSRLTEVVGADPATLVARVTDRYLGQVGSAAVGVLLIASMFAAVLALHNVLTRYFHSMSRARLLPSGIGEVHPRHRSPHRASLLQIGIATVVIVLDTVAGLAPETVFTWFAGIGTLAIVVLMTVTCLAVVTYFARSAVPPSPWQGYVAPLAGLGGLGVAAWLIGSNFPLLVDDVDAAGNPAWGAVSYVLLAVVILAPALGTVQALLVRARNPEAFTGITQKLDH
ncbi:APC family permease [Prauserella halophila]|uniref:APC family permease n=1 Tax=Prauserella halophila TaxID=185641 RepID=A0ABN1WJP0_9PSEU|nr:APC family permease [Prauserella halophila]MCP2238198.1 amino acid/polyamine/organocation transporter, APC superfamily (TC 2.A.3) [Prauserella halophila]